VPDFSQTFKNVAVTPITVTSPAATTYTAGSVSTPPTVAAAAAALTLGNTTPELQAAASKVDTNAAKSIATGVTSALADIKAGKALPAALATNVKTLIASGAANAFLATLTKPTVDGKAIGGRTGGNPGSNVAKPEVEMASIANACNDAIKLAFDNAKKGLDDGKAAEIAKIKAAYDNNIKAADVAADKATALTLKTQNLAVALSLFNTAYDGLNAALTAKKITQSQYNIFVAIMISIYQDTVNNYEALYSATIAALDAKAKAITDKAKAASDADTKKVTDEYNTQLAAITKTYTDENIKCHNQGGGN